jgi:phosphoglycerol transferase
MAVLIATTGGFGSLFALVVTPIIRGYARMHVFVGFLALFAVILLLEKLSRRSARIGTVACGLVLGIGFFDQVSPPAVRRYAEVKGSYDKDAAFVRTIEAAVPARAMILELPYQSFPEGAASSGGVPLAYAQLRPYMHSQSLRWSFPAMRGRSVDAWAERVSALPPDALVGAAADAGFDGILIDRRGYLDGGAKIEEGLAGIIGAGVTPGNRSRYAFFNLVEHNRQAMAAVPADERARRRDLAEHELNLRWTGGFFPFEGSPTGEFRWCAGAGAIEIDNDARVDRAITLTMTVWAANPPMTLTIGGDLMSETATVGDTGLPIERTLRLRPGRHTITMSGDGKPLDAPRDPRRLVWRVEDPTLEELP